MFRKYMFPAVGVAMFVFAVFHVVRAQQVQSRLDPIVPPATSPFESPLAGTGIVEPETENISVGSHHAGIVREVLVKVGDRVEKGKTPLFRLDDRQVRAELALRRANLKAAQSRLDKLKAMPRPEELPPAEAKLREAEANLADMRDQYERIGRVERSSVADFELVRRRTAMEAAKAQVERARADLKLLQAGAWKPDVEVAEAAVEQAQAELGMTETDWERLEVCASIDGEVLQVKLRPGEFIGAPPNETLIVLGGTRKHVRVDIDENSIARFHPGMPARTKVRGDAKSLIPLRFVRVEPLVVPKKSLAGGTTERIDTRVLQVIYAVEPTDVPLYVGQQVDVFLDAAK